MSNTIENRSEILFIYQVKDANPNGDPLEENMPRMDPDTGVATVTDVRIKRWIRDYWHAREGKDLWVEGETSEIKTAKKRIEELKKQYPDEDVDELAKKLIDVRVFGAVMPAKGSKSVTYTGPVQFSNFNRSFHRVQPVVLQGTAAFATNDNASQRSFREDRFLHYACIGVYGIVNEVAAKTTGMTEEDRQLLLKGLWYGCLDLISRSKFGHLPLMLLHIKYKDGFRIGNLTQLVDFKREVEEDERIRDIDDFTLDLTRLADKLEANQEKILSVEYKMDSRVRFSGTSPKDLLKAKEMEL